jgi:hypothetical protein
MLDELGDLGYDEDEDEIEEELDRGDVGGSFVCGSGHGQQW